MHVLIATPWTWRRPDREGPMVFVKAEPAAASDAGRGVARMTAPRRVLP